MSTYQEIPAPMHNALHVWMSNDRNKYRIINRVLLNLGLAGELKLLGYEPERPLRRSPADRICAFIDGLMTISLEDDEGNKCYFLFLCEYKPEIPNEESLLRQIQIYEDLLAREPFVKQMDMKILRVLLTFDPDDAWDKTFRTKQVHVFRATLSLDELFWDPSEPKMYEEPWRRTMSALADLGDEVVRLKELLAKP